MPGWLIKSPCSTWSTRVINDLSREYRGHPVQVTPLRVDVCLEFFGITPKLTKTTLLIDIRLDRSAVRPLIDPVTATIEHLEKRKQTTTHREFNQFGTLIGL